MSEEAIDFHLIRCEQRQEEMVTVEKNYLAYLESSLAEAREEIETWTGYYNSIIESLTEIIGMLKEEEHSVVIMRLRMMLQAVKTIIKKVKNAPQ